MRQTLSECETMVCSYKRGWWGVRTWSKPLKLVNKQLQFFRRGYWTTILYVFCPCHFSANCSKTFSHRWIKVFYAFLSKSIRGLFAFGSQNLILHLQQPSSSQRFYWTYAARLFSWLIILQYWGFFLRADDLVTLVRLRLEARRLKDNRRLFCVWPFRARAKARKQSALSPIEYFSSGDAHQREISVDRRHDLCRHA